MRSPIEMKTVYSLIGAAVFVFTAYHGLNAYIEARISAKISNPIFLKELARNIRPSVVFDGRESVIADQGAMAYIQRIKIDEDLNNPQKMTITITPIEYIGVEPVLEAFNNDFDIRAERGAKYDWVFHLTDLGLRVSGGLKEYQPTRFRLELIRW